MTRHLLRTICRTLIGVLLFAQWAVAAHACPGPASMAAMQMSAAAPAPCDGMAGAMGASVGALCAAHCQQGQQSDHAATLMVPTALFSALYLTAPAPEPRVAPRPAAGAASALAAAAPPHAILHCCWRT